MVAIRAISPYASLPIEENEKMANVLALFVLKIKTTKQDGSWYTSVILVCQR